MLSKSIVDEIVEKINFGSGDLQKLYLLIALSFIANITGDVITNVSNRIGDHFAGKLREFLTHKFYTHILTLPQNFFDTELSGKIIHQLNRGITSMQSFFNVASNFILPTLMQIILTIIILLRFNPPTAFFVFILFPIYIFISYISAKRWGKEELRKNRLEDITRGRIQEVISNIKVVKSYNNEIRETGFINDKLKDINRIYAKQSTTYHIFDFLRNLSLNIVLLLINIVVFISTFQGTLTIGEMVLIIQLVAQARRPLFAMSFILSQVQTAESGSRECLEILKLPSVEKFREPESKNLVKTPKLIFNDVSFKYENSETILKKVNFTINPLEKVALIGPSGAGKSTVVNLLLKFYQPTKGEIYLGTFPYSKLTHKYVRAHIALVFQENELFSTTIKNNVAYGLTASDTEVKKALKQANAYDFVMNLPKGLDSEVGERGVRLSGGQKQRIQIARAILRNAPILILDEATSNLDSKSESEIQDALEHLMANKLVIIIAHRFSTIQDVDRVIVIDEGKIVDSGKPQVLANKPGIYADLLRYQIEGNKKLLSNFEIY